MASVTSRPLPNELWCQIFSYLKGSEKNHIKSTCRLFYTLACQSFLNPFTKSCFTFSGKKFDCINNQRNYAITSLKLTIIIVKLYFSELIKGSDIEEKFESAIEIMSRDMLFNTANKTNFLIQNLLDAINQKQQLEHFSKNILTEIFDSVLNINKMLIDNHTNKALVDSKFTDSEASFINAKMIIYILQYVFKTTIETINEHTQIHPDSRILDTALSLGVCKEDISCLLKHGVRIDSENFFNAPVDILEIFLASGASPYQAIQDVFSSINPTSKKLNFIVWLCKNLTDERLEYMFFQATLRKNLDPQIIQCLLENGFQERRPAMN